VEYMSWMFADSKFKGDISKWDFNPKVDKESLFWESSYCPDELRKPKIIG